MNSIGLPELFLIFVVGLIFFSPKDILKLIRNLGQLLRRVSDFQNEFQRGVRRFGRELERELDEEESEEKE